ncbi:hypothetical protein WT72_30320 [Burkholderia pseudomultivorans]|nr:hypothetical protein WT72_30320 [Burkholderia pseudomultivorans]
MAFRRMSTDEQWASERLQGFPVRWRDRIDQQWRVRHAARNIDARRTANLFLLDITSRLNALKLPLNADDATIREVAARKAAECLGLAPDYTCVKARRAALERVVRQFNCEPPKPMRVSARTGVIHGVMDEPAILRMTCAIWWRKRIRVMHAQYFEAAALALGFINAKMGAYVSDESLKRRTQQRARNDEILKNILATNEEGACFTLAELRDRSVSSPAVKRGELMTRIKGFEDIARELGHVGLFFTITCPSRMHRFTKGKKRIQGKRIGHCVRENPRYDGTLPNEAQAYLSAMFARLRAYLSNRGVRWYGFRIAEPNHDGTPHWHFLVFFDPALYRKRQGVRAPGQRGRVKSVFVRDEGAALMPRICAWIRRYALLDSPDERGAKHHRVDFKPIDWKRGTAAGYIAKYVAKNIDGFGIQDDMLGNAGLETSLRVDAWASTWRIRQFQQVGGPPVTTWREARRMDKVPEGAPTVLDEMYEAVNKRQNRDGEITPASWAKYVMANGGIHCRRDDRPVQLYREFESRLGRYGEAVGEVVKGLEASGIRFENDGIVVRRKFAHIIVRTVHHMWKIAPRKREAEESGFARAARAWTRVNNCTQDAAASAAEIDDWLADYDRAERTHVGASGLDPETDSEFKPRILHSARAADVIRISADDVRDWLADYDRAGSNITSF